MGGDLSTCKDGDTIILPDRSDNIGIARQLLYDTTTYSPLGIDIEQRAEMFTSVSEETYAS